MTHRTQIIICAWCNIKQVLSSFFEFPFTILMQRSKNIFARMMTASFPKNGTYIQNIEPA